MRQQEAVPVPIATSPVSTAPAPNAADGSSPPPAANVVPGSKPRWFAACELRGPHTVPGLVFNWWK